MEGKLFFLSTVKAVVQHVIFQFDRDGETKKTRKYNMENESLKSLEQYFYGNSINRIKSINARKCIALSPNTHKAVSYN